MTKDLISAPNRKLLWGVGLLLLIVLVLQIAFQWRQIHYTWIEVPRMRFAISSLQGLELKNVEDIGGTDGLEMWVTLQIKDQGQVILFNPTFDTFANDKAVVMLGIGDCLLVGRNIATLPLSQIIKDYQALYEATQLQLKSC